MTMADQTPTGRNHARTIRSLSELIDALDRRVPQVERAREMTIARTAASLRVEALRRIAALEQEMADAAAHSVAKTAAQHE